MKKPKWKIKISRLLPLLFIGLLGFVFLNSSIFDREEAAVATYSNDSQNAAPITVTPDVPKDIFSDGTPAYKANLSQAANFAWNEFIALNWPAHAGTRDVPNKALKFGSQGGKTPLVWHTYRHKVETYPGNHKPPPGYNPNAPDFGYNSTPPSYFYRPKDVGTKDGQVSPCGVASKTTPWINLDEKNEIGVTTMYAGVSKGAGYPDPQILFLAKSNEQEFKYVANNKWWAGGLQFAAAQKKTKAYIKKNQNTPPFSWDNPSLVSFPPGTIEVKTGWRRLTDTEKKSGRFYSTTVRYYTEGDNDKPCYVDDEFGMLALHIIHKTPTAPYFIYATFEHWDNILTKSGDPVEDVAGNIIRNKNLAPTTPELTVTNATATTPQMFSPRVAHSMPENSLYYINAVGGGTPVGIVTYNRRYNDIPQEIISANKTAQALINSYNSNNGIKNSPFANYKLVNVQYAPLDKKPGVDYTGPRRSEYYLSNSVVESDYTLQLFSGGFSKLADKDTTLHHIGNTISDYNSNGTTAYNAYYNGKYLMGGCMGCHGNATNGGSDYSFILGYPVTEPEFPKPVHMSEARLKNLMKNLNN